MHLKYATGKSKLVHRSRRRRNGELKLLRPRLSVRYIRKFEERVEAVFRFFRRDTDRLTISIANDRQGQIALLFFRDGTNEIAVAFHLFALGFDDNVSRFQPGLSGG